MCSVNGALGGPPSDLEGRRRSAGRALRPVFLAAPRIEPFVCTGLPLLPRRTTEDLFETRCCYPDDTQAGLSRSKFGDGFCFDCFDGRLEPARRRSEERNCRVSALVVAVEYAAEKLHEFCQIISGPHLELNRLDRLDHESLARANGLRDDDCVLGGVHSEDHARILAEVQGKVTYGNPLPQVARMGKLSNVTQLVACLRQTGH